MQLKHLMTMIRLTDAIALIAYKGSALVLTFSMNNLLPALAFAQIVMMRIQ